VVIVVLEVVLGVFCGLLWLGWRWGASSCGNLLVAAVALIVVPLILADLVALWVVSGLASTQVTLLLSLLGILTGVVAWIVKRGGDTIQTRAQVLIQEYLACGPRTRPEIRAHIYAQHPIYRLSRSTYVDALGVLLNQGRVCILPGKRYSLVRSSK
jgi:hypothetical protein